LPQASEVLGQALPSPRRPTGDWDLVHGELMTFANPGFDLSPIDRLEAFEPNGALSKCGFW